MSRARSMVTRTAAALAVAAALLAGSARADGLSLRLDPTFAFVHQETEEAVGVTTRSDTWQVGNRVRIGWTTTPYSALRLTTGLVFDDRRTWTTTDDKPQVTSDGQRWNGYGHLSFGDNVIGGALSASRIVQEDRFGGQARAGAIRDSAEARFAWRPADLPDAVLSLQHTHNFTTPVRTSDRYSDEARLDTGYSPFSNLQLRYGVAVQRTDDRVGDVVTQDQTHFARVSWSESLLQNRLNVAADYSSSLRYTSTTAGAGGGVLTTAVVPSGGVSKVVSFPATQGEVTLAPNGALVDSVLGSTAGVNIGFGRSAAGDTDWRAMGAQFPRQVVQPTVSRVYVWVDQRLPAEVVADLTWEAWVSDDNVRWTRLGLAGTPTFADLDARFEIDLAGTTARYVRLDVKPLRLGVTTDVRYESIAVTELQFFSVASVSAGTTRSDRLGGTLSASARALLLQDPSLIYSLAAILTHSNRPLAAVWSVNQGLSLARQLTPSLTGSAQLQRSDDGGTNGQVHTAVTRWGGALAWDPLPTFGANTNYGGQWVQAKDGTALSHTVGAAARAELYTGVSASSIATGSVSRNAAGREGRGLDLSTSLTLVPNAALSASGSYGYRVGSQKGGGQADVTDRQSRVDLAAAFNPFPALSLSATASRSLTGPRSTQAALSAGFSPFQGGALQFRSGYTITIDTSSDTTNRLGSAGLRWSWRGGAYLEAGYSDTRTASPSVDTLSQGVFVSLGLPLL